MDLKFILDVPSYPVCAHCGLLLGVENMELKPGQEYKIERECPDCLKPIILFVDTKVLVSKTKTKNEFKLLVDFSTAAEFKRSGAGDEKNI